MTKKTVYFHVGTTKTGSTSIQNFLIENRGVLERNEVALYTGHEKDPADQLRVRRAFCGGVDASFYAPGAEICPESTIILTEEVVWFSLWQPRRQQGFSTLISRMQEFADVKIILYLRRQDNFMMSSYQECLKYGWLQGKSCRQEMRKNSEPSWQYRARLEWLIPLVGRENIIIRPFEKGQFAGGSLMEDFMNSVGLKLTDEYTLSDERGNVGLSPFVAEILRCLSFYKQEASTYERLVEFAFDQGGPYLSGEQRHNYLPAGDRHQLMQRFEEANQWIAREMLGREDGVLFYEPLPPADEPWEEYKLNPREVRDFFSQSDFFTARRRKKMCRQVLLVCGERKPVWMRIRDRSKVVLRKALRKRGLKNGLYHRGA